MSAANSNAGDRATTSTRSRPSLCWPACRRRSAAGTATRSPPAGLLIGPDGRGHGRRWRRSWNTSTRSRPSLRWPACRRHVHHAAGLSIGVDGRGHGRKSWNTSNRSRPSLRWPACRRHVHHGPGLSIGVDGRGRHRHGRRSWNTVHQVKTLALLASMPAPIGDTFTTRAGCRLVWTAAGTAAGAIGTAGDPGTRPPGRGPRFAGQHAGDTFTTRPGCRSVWMAAGTGGDPGTRPPGRGPRFAGQHAGADRRHVHHAAGLSIGVDGRGRHRHGRRSWNTSTRSRPSLRWPACRRHVHHAAGLSIGVDGRGHGRKSWNTSTGSRPSLCSPRARAVDRCGRPRVPSALAEILEHVHRVEALASLASMPAPIGDTFTTGPGCRSVWTAAGAIGTAGDPGTRPPGRGPRFAGQHAGDTSTTGPGCRSVWTAAGTIGTAGDPGTRPPGQGPRFAGQHAGDTSTTGPGCRSAAVRTRDQLDRLTTRPVADVHPGRCFHAAGLPIGADQGRAVDRQRALPTTTKPTA